MPLINVFTSAELPGADKVESLLKDLSSLLAKRFGKPERYVMTSLVPRPRMTFAATSAPACFVEIKNVGAISPTLARTLSAEVSSRLQQALGARLHARWQVPLCSVGVVGPGARLLL